jgi:L-alanine-DL-glutamate epimerase-like enolase superfamily enzyme
MKVTQAESFLLRIPVGREIADSKRSVSELEFVGIRLRTDTGLSGTGYTVTVGHGGSVIREVIDTLFLDELPGRDPHDVRAIWQDLYFGKALWIGRAGAVTMAQAAVDIALWDLVAKAADEPLWRVLGGGAREDVPIYNTHAGWLNYSQAQLCEEACALLDQGYTALKMKVGRERLDDDRRRVEAVRKAVGDEVMLMVDANQAWDLRQATAAAKALAAYSPGWLEEPMHPDDVRGHSKLARRTDIPIALGEHVYGTHAFRDFIERNAVSVVQVDVCRVGGITPWLEVAAVANEFGLPVCPHAGDLMQVHQHLVRAIPNRWLLEVIPIWDPGPFEHPVRLKDGLCRAPMAPGASSDFTQQAFESYASN